jgi:hypothetical protein
MYDNRTMKSIEIDLKGRKGMRTRKRWSEFA